MEYNTSISFFQQMHHQNDVFIFDHCLKAYILDENRFKDNSSSVGDQTMKDKNSFIMPFLFVAIVILLSWYVSGQTKVEVNQDSSGEMDYNIQIQKSSLASNSDLQHYLTDFKKSMERNGFITSAYQDRRYIGVHAMKHLSDIKSLYNAYLFASISDEKYQTKIIKTNGFLFDTFQLVGNYDLTKLIQKGGAAQFKFDLAMPEDASINNASRITTKDQLKTYEWDLIPGQNNEIKLQAKVLDVDHFVLFLFALMMLSLVICFALWEILNARTNLENA